MTEEELWELQKANAIKSFDYWLDFMGFADKNGDALSENCKKRLLCIVRLVSWVESHHGTVGANEPTRDPMQSGNPYDIWWQILTGEKGDEVDRFVRGKGKIPNYWGPQLPGAVEPLPEPGFDIPAIPWTDEQIKWVNEKLKGHTQLPLPADGHNSSAFTPWMSYFWGVIYLLHKIFGGSWKLNDCSCKSLINKAVGYNGVGNGAGDPKYKQKLEQAAKDIGCCKDD